MSREDDERKREQESILADAGSGNSGRRQGFWLVIVKPVGSIAPNCIPYQAFFKLAQDFFFHIDLPLVKALIRKSP